MRNVVDTVENRVQNAILAAVKKIITPKIELAVRSINATSGQDVANIMTIFERK